MMTTIRWRLALVSILIVPAGLAQTPTVQDLQTQLRQFEESTQKTIQDLKAQIAAMQQAQKTAAAAATAAVAAQAQEVPVVHTPAEYYGTETRTRNTAGQNEVGAPRIDNEPLDPKLRGFFHLPGTSTYMKFGGFVKTDLFYDLNYAGTYYGAYVPSSFPSSPTPHTQNSTVSMRPTRFTWETRQGTLDNSENEVKVYFEFDFLSNYDRNSIRLRQFYGQYKNFLAGQAWSAFSDPDAFPDTLEFEGPPGMIAARFPQFRYTQPINKHHSVGVSIEKSGTDTPFSHAVWRPDRHLQVSRI